MILCKALNQEAVSQEEEEIICSHCGRMSGESVREREAFGDPLTNLPVNTHHRHCHHQRYYYNYCHFKSIQRETGRLGERNSFMGSWQ